MPSRLLLHILAGTLSLGAVLPAQAAETHVAVASNFTGAAKEIAQAFKAKTGDEAVLSFGSTGQLYTQISQGAPFEVLLAADEARPKKAITNGLAVPDSRFTYATGKIVLWSQDPNLVRGEATLTGGNFSKIAIANPTAAPYGAAAVQAMRALKVYDQLEPRIVQGNNIAQTYQFVATGNAELGFVALSQVANTTEGSRWVVPGDLYDRIRQDAVLLKKAADSKVAKAFVAFLKGPEAARIMERYGYGTGVS
jgi:molybdate transport system substrate-binding protein